MTFLICFFVRMLLLHFLVITLFQLVNVRRNFLNEINQILVIEIQEYAYIVPYVESDEGRFLKTIIPSRKATREFLGARDEDET